MKIDQEKIKSIIAKQLMLHPAHVEGYKKFESLDCDSLDMIEILMQVEDEFDMNIPDHKLPLLLSMTVDEFISGIQKISDESPR